MRIAGREFAEGVADANDRTTIELVVWYALAFDPAAISKAIAVLAAKPLLAAQVFRFFAGWAAVVVAHGVLPVKGQKSKDFKILSYDD